MSSHADSPGSEDFVSMDLTPDRDKSDVEPHEAPIKVPASPTIIRLSGLGLENAMLGQPKPGNAFAGMKHRDSEYSKLPRKSGGEQKIDPRARPGSNLLVNGSRRAGLPKVTSPVEPLQRPVIVRKPSNLDYDEDLALPMPKPRHTRMDPADEAPMPAEEWKKVHVGQKRCAMDPSVPARAGVSASGSLSADSKKMSRLEAIRSKLSFKDLRKECAKEEITSQFPSPSPDDPKTRSRWGIPGSSSPSIAPSVQSVKPKFTSTDDSQVPGPAGTMANTTSQMNLAPTRIPLPPSGTFSDIQGTMAAPKSPMSPPNNVLGGKAPTVTGSKNMKNTSSTTSSRAASVSTADFPPDIVVSCPSLDTAQKRLPTRAPSTPNSTLFKYLGTKDSPGNTTDICEDGGKAKYLPKDWPRGSSTPSPQTKVLSTPSSAFDENEAGVDSLTDHLPSFKERLQKANISFSQSHCPEMHSQSSALHIDEIVTMVQSIQRQTNSGISCISKKLEDLSAWIGDQLKNQIEGISDLGRANSDLFAKQCQISREMMKFQLDMRLDIGVMEKRLTDFESKLLDGLQNEVRQLARSFEELNHRTEALIAKYSSSDNQSFIELQRQKNAEIEREIAHVKGQQVALAAIAPFHAQSIHQMQPRPSESSTGSAEPLIRQAEMLSSVPHFPVAPTPAGPLLESKSVAVFPRSVSLTRKGLLKGIKDMASTSPESKERVQDKAKTTDDSKKWNVFGFRRRRDPNEPPGSTTKFPWSSSRRAKDIPMVDEPRSSRSSSPPVPAILRNIPSSLEIHRIDRSNVHPALRSTLQEGTAPQDRSPSTSLETSTPSSAIGHNHAHDKAAAEGLHASPSDKLQPSMEASQSTSFHTGAYGSSSVQSSSEDMQKVQALGDSELNPQEWDRITFHGSDTPN
ncbi:hypothetical protein N7492_001882 [Penicillium capsulatum]|uniref:Uncharacterized protein n=1 Tax=Penicillium capsulatum TaxID=69766 RepID=A0A9W9IVI1_9EURO|nr:hypothetical protein N7492_001882 [Penicillium capsulatum]KAJ6129070.1 hypothetical protein N7512_001850 [Penicillium capsulatum]